jgi:predicted DNA-binding transcriptional regulator AlpA
VTGVDPRELIASFDVAEILGLAQASSVTTYLRRYDDFPRPVVDIERSHVRLWRRSEIEAWAHGRRMKRASA